MGCGSTNERINKPVKFKDEISNKPVEIKEETTGPKNYSYCFKEREITYIQELKEKKDQDIKNGTEKGGDNFYPLYKKIELDLSNRESIIKEYLVFYIPKNYSKSILIYKGTPPIDYIAELIEKTNPNKYPKYAKINNSPKAIKKFECKQKPKVQYASYISYYEFEISESDKEKNLITLEAGYKMELYFRYGIYKLRFYCSREEEPLNKSSFSFIFDNNYMACHINKKYFDEISKYKLYSFNREDISLTLKDKRIKINIEDELEEEFLSKFSPEEIKQINFSLNTIEYHYDFRHLIYHKVIHNIKDNKDYIKVCYVVFYPHDPSGCSGGSSSPDTGSQPIIIKRFTINNLLVKKEKKYKGDEYDDYQDEENNQEEENVSEDVPDEAYEERIKMYDNGYYLSDENKIGFYVMTNEIWALYEFECESNENLDYFQLHCDSFGDIDESIIYGGSYKYEIILNGHSIKFSNPDFQYSVKNGKITLEGFIDGNKENFDEKKFAELAKKYNRKWYLDEESLEYKMKHWAELRLLEFIPKTMKLV